MNLEKTIDVLREEIIKSTRELIAIESIESSPKDNMPFGENIQKALDYALNLSRKMGFKVVNLDNYIGYAEFGEGDEYIAILGHLDVVPEGEGWIGSPYSGDLIDGKIYGRGALDDKGPTIAALYALKAIKDSNIKINKRVRIIFGTNEETGCTDIPYYLEREKPPIMGFTPDADFPVIHGEKGLLIFDVMKEVLDRQTSSFKVVYIKGGTRENMVPDYCESEILTEEKSKFIDIFKRFIDDTYFDMKFEETDMGFIIKSYGVSAHGSTPHLGKNAIMQLVNLLALLNLNGSLGEFISFLNNKISFSTKGEGLEINLHDEVSGSLSMNLGIIDVKMERCLVSLDVRHPVTFKLEDVMKPLKKNLIKEGMKIQNLTYNDPLYFDVDHPLVKSLQDVYCKITGEDVGPITIGGGTYAKEMPNTVAFGPSFPGNEDVAHKPNEYISVEDLITCCKIYSNAILKLSE
ncbi:dipeptidase PepV [Clostridium cylindrosporum]|uniref:Dipeptidase n=1 Tax=Clostridium cylindrosporum DSM 605 TaxID=1121307 RepID=A0A0J8DEE7_CLOCY|nr:dipeptidase PepV [Clostridium cylindrosporum]KMT22599.1 dipeptidase [Clostridium cylindrosporum DSM 605]